ncbi:MAG: ABC transporter substrate-binding protein [Acidobacteriota bacterium]
MTLRALVLSLLLGAWPFARAFADEMPRNIAVIYPEIGEPYRSVFTSIMDGIEEQAKGRVTAIAVGANPNTQDIAGELHRRDVRAVIALGRNGLKVATALDRQWGVVAGGVLSVPESQARDFSVHSLAPDPALLLARLKTLVPSARRVIVVYDPRQNDWLIRLAQEAAKSQGLELSAYEAQDLKGAVHQYREAMQAADPKKDVLWLPQDSTTVDDAVVLPMVLEDSWTRGLPVFSSSVNHVKRGVLFSLYPDNAELGRVLGRAALGYANGGASQRGVWPLKEVLLAVNTRTANHLGLNLDARRLRVDMVYPEP